MALTCPYPSFPISAPPSPTHAPRVGDDGAGDGDALLLPAGELGAALPAHGAVAGRQQRDEAVGVGQPARRLHLRRRRGLLLEQEIVDGRI